MGRRTRGERGNIAIWAVFAFTVVGGFMALAINVGRAYSNRGELQNGADAAALAAAAELNGALDGISHGEEAAGAFGAQHSTENLTIGIDPANDVTFGEWDRETRVFTPVAGRSEADLQRIIAVQVRGARLGMPVAFGGPFLGGASAADVRSSAIAVGGGPCEDRCAFPAAFADCMLLDADERLKCDERFYVLNSDWQDNLGLTSLVPGESASVPSIKDALRACVETRADQPIPVTNGNPVQPLVPFFPAFPAEVVAPVVHVERCEPARHEKCVSSGSGPEATCVNAKFVGDMPIRGYASFVLCYVTGSTVKTWPPADWGANPDGSPETAALWAECGAAPTLADFPGVDPSQWPDPFLKHTIFMKHRCRWEDPGHRAGIGGCESFGIWTSRSRLVQ
jgi:hypothetical protein